MLRWLPVVMIVVPLVELYLLLTLGRLVGLGPTVAIVVLTGVLGSAMARLEGLRVWKEWLLALRELRSPAQGILEGVLILLGGALLITPGVLTDLGGLLLLLPPTRRLLVRPLRRAVEAHIAQTSVRIVGGQRGARGASRRPNPDGVVDTTGESLGEHDGHLPGR